MRPLSAPAPSRYSALGGPGAQHQPEAWHQPIFEMGARYGSDARACTAPRARPRRPRRRDGDDGMGAEHEEALLSTPLPWTGPSDAAEAAALARSERTRCLAAVSRPAQPPLPPIDP